MNTGAQKHVHSDANVRSIKFVIVVWLAKVRTFFTVNRYRGDKKPLRMDDKLVLSTILRSLRSLFGTAGSANCHGVRIVKVTGKLTPMLHASQLMIPVLNVL